MASTGDCGPALGSGAAVDLRPLGSTGIQVSPLGLGTVKIGRNSGVKYPHGFSLPEDREVRSLLGLAQDLGINLVDTAPAYGSSEERLGRLLPGPRDAWVISTKVGERFHQGLSSFDYSAAGTRRSVERSLRRLATDYLDLVLIHSDGRDERIVQSEPVLETLRALQKAGLVRALGVSTKTVSGGLLAVEETDLVMATYNSREREERAVIRAAAARGKGVLIKKALASGHLERLTDSQDDDPVAAALGCIFAESGVSSAVLGTIDPAHLRANVAVTERLLERPCV